uniref:Coiled-coil domain-containing protein 158-like n=1 Tax=Fundulus heteroclitus TaxID=8078 RepID=A0A3Q2NUC6_FUNHE
MSNSNPPEPQLPVDSQSNFLTYDCPAGGKQTHAETASQSSPLRLRFSSLTLDELSEQLDRRTKETQQLQEEIENATREALRRFGCTYSSTGQSCYKNDSAEDPSGGSAHAQPVTQAVVCCLDALKLDEAQRDRGFCKQEWLENSTDRCLEQLSDLQLNEGHSEEQETFSPQRAFVNMQVKLNEAQMENDVLSDQRAKGSRANVDQVEKMLRLLEERQNIKRSADQELQETEGEAPPLHRKVEPSGKVVKKVCSTPSEKPFGKNLTCNKNVKHRGPPPCVGNPSKETDRQHCTVFSQKERQRNQEDDGSFKRERMEDLITSLGQEMATLTDKLSSSKLSGVNLCAKLGLLKHVAERQTSLHHCQISDLESALSGHSDKSFCEKQRLEHREGTEVLRGQLELSRKQLCAAEEEKSCLQALLEQRSRETLQAEHEALRLKLIEREKTIDILRPQVERSVQTAARHSDAITKLQRENSFLIDRHRHEIQQLKAELVQHQSDLERERRELQASLTEQKLRVQEETAEKQRVMKQLELQRRQLFSLTEEHEELRRLHSCKNDEHQAVVLKLQSQLRSAHHELHHTRRGLKTLKAADGHGLRVALDMQKEITARREEADSLQSRIQHLEEKVEKMQQEERRQNLETHRQLQELTFVREEKRQLANELTALRSKDHQLRERINELESILHKMWESLANCQDFLQLREQEYFPLKLQHALNLKELPGQDLCAFQTVSPPELNSRTPSAPTAPPSSEHPYTTQIKEDCACELSSLVKGIQAVSSDNHRPHTDKSAVSSSFHRRRSAPERQDTATIAENEEGVKFCSRLRRKTCSSEPRFLKTTEPNGQTVNNRDEYLIFLKTYQKNLDH